MASWWTLPTVQAGLGVVVLCILIAAGFWLVSSFRDRTAEDRFESDEMLSNLEEMHREGDISEKEFRTIKASMDRHRGNAINDGDAVA